jgi:hypothetical protein
MRVIASLLFLALLAASSLTSGSCFLLDHSHHEQLSISALLATKGFVAALPNITLDNFNADVTLTVFRAGTNYTNKAHQSCGKPYSSGSFTGKAERWDFQLSIPYQTFTFTNEISRYAYVNLNNQCTLSQSPPALNACSVKVNPNSEFNGQPAIEIDIYGGQLCNVITGRFFVDPSGKSILGAYGYTLNGQLGTALVWNNWQNTVDPAVFTLPSGCPPLP